MHGPEQRPRTARRGASKSHVADELDRLARRVTSIMTADPVAMAALTKARDLVERQRAATGTPSLLEAPSPDPEDEARLEELWQTLGDRLRAPDALGSVVPDETLVRLLLALVSGDSTLAGDAPFRFLELAAIPGRILWAVLTDADVGELRSAIRPGQVWIRADLVGSDQWPLVRAMAASSVQMAGLGRPPGRPSGSRQAALAPIVAAVAANPEMTNAEITSLAQDVWTRLRLADDYTAQRKRINRIRQTGQRTKKS